MEFVSPRICLTCARSGWMSKCELFSSMILEYNFAACPYVNHQLLNTFSLSKESSL